MAIPGLKPNYDVRAKVRIGEKKQTSGGKEYPSATDYFICEDDEFQKLYPGKPKKLRVLLAFGAPADAFSTGLEMWRGRFLACYSKGEKSTVEGNPYVAYRRQKMKQGGRDFDLLAGERVIGEPMGQGKERTPIACRFRECPFFQTKECKPMGRLQFFLEGGRTDAVLQLDTKAWNSIEKIEAALGGAAASGDLRGRVFELSVRIEQRGAQKFPVLSMTEADLIVNDDKDLAVADALVQLRKAVDGSEADPGGVRPALAAALDHTTPGWRTNEQIIARIKEIGPLAGAAGLLGRFEL